MTRIRTGLMLCSLFLTGCNSSFFEPVEQYHWRGDDPAYRNASGPLDDLPWAQRVQILQQWQANDRLDEISDRLGIWP